MRIAGHPVKVFKIKNRKGYACICAGCLTEGKTVSVALDRMVKAIHRTSKNK